MSAGACFWSFFAYVSWDDNSRAHIFLGLFIEHQKDSARVAAGLKAAMHNPNVSSEAKEQAARKLQDLAGGGGGSTETETSAHQNRVLGGFQATLHSMSMSFLKISMCL